MSGQGAREKRPRLYDAALCPPKYRGWVNGLRLLTGLLRGETGVFRQRTVIDGGLIDGTFMRPEGL
jgi:hypothetical protein